MWSPKKAWILLVIVFVIAILVSFFNIQSFNSVSIVKEKLNDSLPSNDSICIILASGFKSDILKIEGRKNSNITTDESCGVAADFYIPCKNNSSIELFVNDYKIKLEELDCRYSQIVIYKQPNGYYIQYFIESRTFD